jgi:hypothetical protein
VIQGIFFLNHEPQIPTTQNPSNAEHRCWFIAALSERIARCSQRLTPTRVSCVPSSLFAEYSQGQMRKFYKIAFQPGFSRLLVVFTISPRLFEPRIQVPSTKNQASGGERTRTDDPLRAKQVLYQLSYTPGRNFEA